MRDGKDRLEAYPLFPNEVFLSINVVLAAASCCAEGSDIRFRETDLVAMKLKSILAAFEVEGWRFPLDELIVVGILYKLK